MTANYDSSAIEVLVGLEPVRQRPGMYTQTDTPNHLAAEVIDNSVDEAIAGHAGKIDVVLHSDLSISVEDNGRGIPVDIHEQESVSGVEVIMTRLHAGAKFSSKNYLHSGGLHGVGVSVVNALSKQLIVHIRRNGFLHQMKFANGDVVEDLSEISTVPKSSSGTRIQFWPDAKFFDSVHINVAKLKRLMLAKAVLCSGLELTLTDENDESNNEVWKFAEGLPDYLIGQLNGSERIPRDPLIIHRSDEQTQVDCAICWTPQAHQTVTESYVNLIPTEHGGTHVNGFRTGITDAVREFCEFQNLLPRGLRISVEDVWRHCSYILSVRMEDPQFVGQTKDRLSSRHVGKSLISIAKGATSLWLNQHISDAERIARLAIENARRREIAAKKVERKKTAAGPALPGKLSDCTSRIIQDTELFLVEGDSAGGSAKQARNRASQAILPLRGKILNTWEVASAQVLASDQVHSIAVALGVDPGSADISGLRYGKVCILADADSDGAHIATLLCALFVRHFRSLVEAGHVYVAMPPLYRVDAGKDVGYALDDEELEHTKSRMQAKRPKAKISVQRFKGLGEMNPAQLKETTMNPDTRRLIQLRIDSSSKLDRTLDMLLGKKNVAERKSWLMQVGDQAGY
ncbi:MAG: DNA topoisomerase IV subunit B [Acidiferrobacterales bacterium]|nr:DNA topoisomerase IV subunit B [Acidiferrobacterales bacterium]